MQVSYIKNDNKIKQISKKLIIISCLNANCLAPFSLKINILHRKFLNHKFQKKCQQQIYVKCYFFGLAELCYRVIVFDSNQLTIIPRVRVGYEMVESQGGIAPSGYNHLISNKCQWNNCFIKNVNKILRIQSVSLSVNPFILSMLVS